MHSRRRRGRTDQLVTLALACLALAAAPARTAPPRSERIRDDRAGIAFTCPAGWRAKHEVTEGGSPIAGDFEVEGRSAFFWIDTHRASPVEQFRSAAASDPSDTLLTFVQMNFGHQCDADGPGGSTTADRIASVRRFRSAAGFNAIEYTVIVVDESWSGGEDEDMPEDSSAVESAPSDTTEDAGTPGISREEHPAGPFFAVLLPRKGGTVIVHLGTVCDHATLPSERAAMLAIVASLRPF